MQKNTKRLLNCILAVQLEQGLIKLLIVVSQNMRKPNILKRMKMKTTKRYQFSLSNPLFQKKPGPCDNQNQTRKFYWFWCVFASILRFRIQHFHLKFPLGILQKFLQLSQFFNQKIKTIDSLATPEQTLSYKHGYFSGDFNKVERIADCTEQ